MPKKKLTNEQKYRLSEFDKVVKASMESNIPGTINNRLKSPDWKTRRTAQKTLSDRQYLRKKGKPVGR